MSKGIEFTNIRGENLKISIVVARWNNDVTGVLLDECKKSLLEAGVADEDISINEVPGSFELVYGAAHAIKEYSPDAVIAIGCLVKGETMHFEYIAEAVSNGLAQLNAAGDVPVIFGVLTCLSEEQARERSAGEKSHGRGWALSAIEMGRLSKQ